MTVWIFALEPIDTRYTRQWHEHLPKQIQKHIGTVNVVQLDGEQVPPKPSPGAFLDFAATNIWKSTQLAEFMRCVQNQQVQKGDYVLVTDAWNPTIIQIKYTSDLLELDLQIGAIWHAGSYDPNDFLGRACGGKAWVQNTERALLNSIDHNFFATNEHIELIQKTYPDINPIRTGFPFEYFEDLFKPYRELEKRDLILFPHRLAPEKQLHVFKELEKRLPEYEFIVCQEKELSKDQYHTLLGQAKIVFSANLQETFGISMIEGLMCNAIPLMPKRLTYKEMYDPKFLYPSIWADADNLNIEALADYLKIKMDWVNPNEAIKNKIKKIKQDYLEGTIMYEKIKDSIKPKNHD